MPEYGDIKTPKPGGFKHKRRESVHKRSRSQHSIASFQDMESAKTVNTLGSIIEGSRTLEPTHPEIDLEHKPKKNHDRKSSNVHELFGEDADGQFDLQALELLAEEAEEDKDSDGELELDLGEEEEYDPEEQEQYGQYSPQAAVPFEDLPTSPIQDQNEITFPSEFESKQKKLNKHNHRQSFGGVVDLFSENELKLSNPIFKQRLNQLEEENEQLRQKLEDSEKSRKKLELEIAVFKSTGLPGLVSELQLVKTSKYELIKAAAGEIDRMRAILIQNKLL